MAGRLLNRKEDTRIKHVTQLRQTKLVLRVTARRLTYNVKSAAKHTTLAQTAESSSIRSHFTLNTECVDTQNAKNKGSAKGGVLPHIHCQDTDLTSVGDVITRPKRNVHQKKSEACGLSWKEETELKKALYASLQRKKNKPEINTSCSNDVLEHDDKISGDNWDKDKGLDLQPIENFHEVAKLECKEVADSPVTGNIHLSRNHNSLFRAQRKFASGSKPAEDSLMSRRKFLKKFDCSVQNNQVIPYTEDFINYLCMRGTPFMPENLKFFDKVLCRNFEANLETPSLCSSIDIMPTTPKTCRQTAHRKVPRKIIRPFSNLVVEQKKVSQFRGFMKRKRRKPHWKKVTRDATSKIPSKTQSVEISPCNIPNESHNLVTSVISLRSGKMVCNEDCGRNTSKDDYKETLTPASSSEGYISRGDNSALKSSTADGLSEKLVKRKIALGRNIFAGRRIQLMKKRRKRRCGIELIDRSWNRSGLKKYMDVPGDGKQTRPVTRSRTVASLKDELNRAKLELDEEDADGDFTHDEEDADP